MTTLRVILDPMVAARPGGVGRYTEELTRGLLATTPPDCEVAGLISAIDDDDRQYIETLLPELSELVRLPTSMAQTELAWRSGITAIPGRTADGQRRGSRAMLHAASVIAPLARHDRINDVGNQTVVTVHDVVPWSHPETMQPRRVSLLKAMVKRAHRHADAVVVPSHAVATELGEILDFGDRIRVIGGAVSPRLTVPVDAEERAVKMGLPPRYILSVGSLEPRKQLGALIQSLAHPDSVDLPLLVAGPETWDGIDVAAVAAEAGLTPDRVQVLGFLADADLAVALDRATVFAFPDLADGFGLPVIEALSFGTPVVHSDAPALLEVAAGAGVAVERSELSHYPERLAQAIASIVHDGELRERLSTIGIDRARAFSWTDSAEKVWQLHADL